MTRPALTLIQGGAPAPAVTDSDVAIAARGICRGSDAKCGCDFGGGCAADELFGATALQAVSALRAAGRMPAPLAIKPCLARADSGVCLSCGVKQGEPCQHPALRL